MLNQWILQTTFKTVVFAALDEDEAVAAYEAYEGFDDDISALASASARLRAGGMNQDEADVLALRQYAEKLAVEYPERKEVSGV